MRNNPMESMQPQTLYQVAFLLRINYATHESCKQEDWNCNKASLPFYLALLEVRWLKCKFRKSKCKFRSQNTDLKSLDDLGRINANSEHFSSLYY